MQIILIYNRLTFYGDLIMYVCICHSVTDRDIIKAAEKGAACLQDLSDALNVATCCGRCASCANNVLTEFYHQSVLVDLPPRMAGAA